MCKVTDQKIGIIVQARMGSTRLPGKAMLPLGDTTVIGMCLRRCAETGLPVVAAVPNGLRSYIQQQPPYTFNPLEVPNDDTLVKHIEELGFPVFRGSEENVLERYVKCAEAFGFTSVVRITGDCPLIDPKAIKEVVSVYENETGQGDALHSYADNIGFCITQKCRVANGYHPSGQDVQVMCTLSMRSQLRRIEDALEHVAELFQNVEYSSYYHRGNTTYKDVKTSIDTAEDYDFVKRCLEDPSLYRNDVVSQKPAESET